MKKQIRIVAIALTLCELFSLVSYARDEAPSAWARMDVERAVALGIVPAHLRKGYTEEITREELAETIISFLAAQYNYFPASLFMDLNFIDEQGEKIERGYTYFDANGMEWYKAYEPFSDTASEEIFWAYQFGIVQGRGDGTFDPQGLITRQEVAALLLRTYNYYKAEKGELNTGPLLLNENYQDAASIAPWAEEAVQTMTSYGIMQGIGGGTFDPTGYCTREQCYLMFLRLYMNMPTSREKENISPIATYEQDVIRVVENSVPFFQCETPDCTVIYRGYEGNSENMVPRRISIVYRSGGIRYSVLEGLFDHFQLSENQKTLSFDDGYTNYTLDLSTATYTEHRVE